MMFNFLLFQQYCLLLKQGSNQIASIKTGFSHIIQREVKQCIFQQERIQLLKTSCIIPKTLMNRRKLITTQSLTGQIQPVTLNSISNRINTIKYQTKNRLFSAQKSYDHNQSRNLNSTINNTIYIRPQTQTRHTIDLQTDTHMTNFWPKQPALKKQKKNLQKQTNKIFLGSNKLIERRSEQLSKVKQTKRPLTSYKYSFRVANRSSSISSLNKLNTIKGQPRALIYKRQIQQFQKLYQKLSEVLASIKQTLFEVQNAISEYANYIQSQNFSFIDDFIQGKQAKLQKIIRMTRFYESLSICFLFLEIAKAESENNQSYLINFIGHCLSNLLLTVRVYIIKQRRPQFQESQFQKSVLQSEIVQYGEPLRRLQSILLRIQHNNQIVTMMHKRLGRQHEDFQKSIKNFMKVAEREKYKCSMCNYYIFQYLAMHIHKAELLDISPSLQLAPKPYVKAPQKQYTLVVQPLGVLQKNGKLRPFVHQFMKWASKHFQIILWTWELPVQIQSIQQVLSPYLISALYRHHCTCENQIYVKDLTRLGRDLQKLLIVDFDKRIFAHQESNGIQCRWNGKSSDKGLLLLSQILQQMINSNTNIEDTLTFYAQQIYALKGY